MRALEHPRLSCLTGAVMTVEVTEERARKYLAQAYRTLHKADETLADDEADFFEQCVRDGVLSHGDRAAILAISNAIRAGSTGDKG